jgi:PST family polysaccharide transporter
MKSLFLFQLLGDVVKVGSWIVSNVLLAKAQIKSFIVLEIIFSLAYFVLSVVFFNVYGIRGLTIAFL